MATQIKANTTETALAPFERIRDVLAAYPTDRYHLLTSTTLMPSSPLFIPTPTVVAVNPNDERQVYRTPGSSQGSEDVCFKATTLQRIANAGGLDFDPSLDRHEHDLKSEPLVCRYSVAAWYIDSLGQRRLLGDGVTHDLRDGSPRAKLAASPKQLEVGRQFICEQSRTRAMSRVIRKVMNLQSTYKKSELVVNVDGKVAPKPFVAIRFRLDESDPDVKRALIQRGVGAAQDVFGAAKELPPPPATDELDDVIEGHVSEPTAREPEPAIPDAEPAAPFDIKPIQAALEAAAKRSRVDNGKASDQQLMDIGVGLRDVLDLRNRLDLVKEERPAGYAKVRLAMLTALFGVSSSADLTARQAAAMLAWLATDEGKHQACAVFGEIAAAADLPVQQTLAGAADGLPVRRPALQ